MMLQLEQVGKKLVYELIDTTNTEGRELNLGLCCII